MPRFRFLVSAAAIVAPATLIAADAAPAAEESRGVTVRVGGRLEVEASDSNPDPAAARRFSFESGVDFRRARLLVAGSFRERYEFKLEHDVASGEVEAKDVSIGLRPQGNAPGVRVGHFKEPFSLSVLTSSNISAFIARPAAVTSMAPGRNAGIMVHNPRPDGRVAWAVGAFRDTDGYSAPRGANWNLSGRLAGIVRDDDATGLLLHLGVAASYRQPTAGLARLSGRAGVRLAPRIVDTGKFPAQTMRLLGVEFAMARGPLWLQAESLLAAPTPVGARTARLRGSYVEMGWFVTGENRPYSRKARSFARVEPLAPLPEGKGAWELVARWDDVDLRHGIVAGGAQSSVTFGLNWHLRRDLRALLNYVSTDPAGAGSVEHMGLLLHVDF